MKTAKPLQLYTQNLSSLNLRNAKHCACAWCLRCTLEFPVRNLYIYTRKLLVLKKRLKRVTIFDEKSKTAATVYAKYNLNTLENRQNKQNTLGEPEGTQNYLT